MTDNTENRIRLAEAMGYSWQEDKKIKGWPGMGHWYAPNGDRLPHSHERVRACGHGVAPTFDPFTDANDCEALIRHLNEAGYFLYVGWRDGAAIAEIKRADGTFVDEWEGDDYKQGVCELALKVVTKEVLNNESNQD